jgi:hypothetical protein
MKVSATALCALSMCSWTLAAPIVVSKHETPKYTGSQVGTTDAWRSRTFKHLTPKYTGPQVGTTDTWPVRASKFSIPEAAAQDVLDERPDNRPYSPSGDVTPSEALAAPRPLKTSYLLSIKPSTHGQEKNEEKTPDTWTEYPGSSIVKEETGSVVKHHSTIVELETQGNKPIYAKMPCATRQGHFYLVRRYADMGVVGIIFILMAIIALIELWDPICRM